MKKYILSFAAVVFALTMVAFTHTETKKEVPGTVYYRYKLSDHNITNMKAATNWEVSTPTNCLGNNYICKIELPDTQDLQDFLDDIVEEDDFAEQEVLRSEKN